MKIERTTRVAAMLRYGIFVPLSFALFAQSALASTISGGSYTLNGGPTAISSAQSSGGTYSEQSTADPASGNSSGGVYGTTPAPAAPAAQNSVSQTTTNPPLQNASGGGVSGQIVLEKVPSSGGTSSTGGVGTGASDSGESGTIYLTNVRIVRGTPTSITVHFTTSVSAIGSIRYSPSSGEMITLTDSTPGIDHTFTLTNLTPVFVYQLQLAAISETGATSGIYEVAVSPNEIGEEGSSVSPPLVPYHPATPAASASPVASSSAKNSLILHVLPPYLLVLLVLIIATIIGIVWGRRNRSQ